MEDVSIRKELERKLASNVVVLEAEVEKRTADLNVKIKELEQLNKSMVNRELKMVELKKENEDLRKPQ